MYFQCLALRVLQVLALFVPVLLGSSCSRLTLDLRAACCINPPSGKCNQECSDARIIELRVYQLKMEADQCRLRWEDFVSRVESESLKGLLSDPQARPLKQNVDRNELRTLPAWELHKDTTHLLIVTVGRHAGPKSIRQLDLGFFRSRHLALYFDKYDVCLDMSCDREPREEGQCQ